MFKADTPEGHRLRHIQLHRAFDELLADYLQHWYAQHSGLREVKGPSNTTVMELMEWSHRQTIEAEDLPLKRARKQSQAKNSSR